jgi:Trk K+ transport system NAD-binding subunit
VGNSKRLDVIHGDPQDEDLLRELDIHSHDIAIAALEDDNLNIAISMRAKDKGVLRTGLVLRDKALVDAVHRIGTINPVSRRQVVVTGILKSIHMNVPGTFQVIPNVPEVISISAEVKAEQGIEGWSVSKAESKFGARIAMIDREDFDGNVSVLDPSQVETVLLGDRLYILLLKEDLKKLEKILGS